MPPKTSSLRFFLSADGLGGPITSVPFTDGLFPNVTGVEAEKGLVDYACFYFVSYVADERGLIDPALWFSHVEGNDSLAIGLDPNGKNVPAQRIANRFAEPVGVTWSAPTTDVLPLYLPSSPYRRDDAIGLWVQRTVQPGSKPGESRFRLRIRGEAF